MKAVLYVLSGVAALGLLIALTAAVAAFLGSPGPLAGREPTLFVGLLIVWLPTIFVSTRLSENVPRKDLWKAALRGCPAWMRYLVYGCVCFFIVNFAVAAAGGKENHPQLNAGFIFSGLTPFFSDALAVLYSGAKLLGEPQRRCADGHVVGPLAKFCDQCGRPIHGR